MSKQPPPSPPLRRRTDAAAARDTASIVVSLKHEGDAPSAEAEAVHRLPARRGLTVPQALAMCLRQAQALQDASPAAAGRAPGRA